MVIAPRAREASVLTRLEVLRDLDQRWLTTAAAFAFGVDPKSWAKSGPLRAAGLTKVWGSSYLGRWARSAATISIFPCRAN